MDMQNDQLEDPNVLQPDAVPANPADFELPSQEKLLEMIEMLNITDEDKQEIRDGLLKNLINRDQGIQRAGLQPSYGVVIFCILAIIFIFVFFGYKLFRSQTEKERKREEKKKQKQQKKKHKS
ncbi:hypothetical protein AMK59_47 [Oryctes borbonicus]|uniref:Uncharacterized protein n=1 Tax=Oryctes borbonicus TaxID=1629725 RepID=A0A0T6BHN4_9SCAR|nr:hypothetical protein AMK59_47 [Oryctes borbonicus]